MGVLAPLLPASTWEPHAAKTVVDMVAGIVEMVIPPSVHTTPASTILAIHANYGIHGGIHGTRGIAMIVMMTGMIAIVAATMTVVVAMKTAVMRVAGMMNHRAEADMGMDGGATTSVDMMIAAKLGYSVT